MSESKDYFLNRKSINEEPNRISRREISEMLGLCRGIIADGVVSTSEVHFLKNWLNAHPLACSNFPGSVIAVRLQRIFSDGDVSDEERSDLLALLQDATGQKNIESVTAPTSLPLDIPAPPIFYDGNFFCFTGKFASGTRTWCQAETAARGGKCLAGVTGQLRYLVIGSVGNERWAHSSFGTKIEKAVSFKNVGAALSIIEEEHWHKSLAGK